MALLFLAVGVGGVSLGGLGGKGQFLIACLGVNGTIIADVVTTGLRSRGARRFGKVVAIGSAIYLALLAAALYGAFGLAGSAADPQNVSVMSLAILALTGVTGLIAASL